MTRAVLALSLLPLALVACAPSPPLGLPKPPYDPPLPSADAELVQAASEAGLGRLDARKAVIVGRAVCEALYNGQGREEAVSGVADREGMSPADVEALTGVAVEVYCPGLG